MVTRTKIHPPFAWLGPYTTAISIISTIAIGGFFRFFQLSSLPPGIDAGSATIGLQALALLDHGTLPSLNSANDYAPLWVWLQTISIKLFGHTEVALRLWPALLGSLAILTTWLWVRSWFGLRTAWLTSFLVAVTPWAVTLSRSGSEAALWPFLMPLTLWLATLAWQRRITQRYLLLAVALILSLLSGPVGWLLVFSVTTIGVVLLWRSKRLFVASKPYVTSVVVYAAGLGLVIYLVAMSRSAVKAIPHTAGFISSPGALGSGLVKTLLMFNVSGDPSYQHNLAGEPLLNAFVGLMFVAGILVAISRLHDRRYRLTLTLLFLLLIPTLVTSVDAPNAARASGALPLVLALSALGISYMLELWYKTFPINSAARATGQSAIIVLLGLTLFQGYSQYFRAWAGSSEVYAVYNEGAVQMAAYLTANSKAVTQNIVVSEPAELPIISYLDHNDALYTPVAIANFAAFPAVPGNEQFFITASARDLATKTLKARFPGGLLYPHYSSFNQSEIYYTYVVAK